jgi:hypothetical protein
MGQGWVLGTHRFRVLTLAAAVGAGLTIAPAAPARADGPVRSGTIAGSAAVVWEGSQGCHQTPDCVAWLAARCNPLLAGYDPAVMTSIVDVRELAGTWRTLTVDFPWGGWLASFYEFWSADCVWLGRFQSKGNENFHVPDGAVWMTIPATGIGAFRWAIF